MLSLGKNKQKMILKGNFLVFVALLKTIKSNFIKKIKTGISYAVLIYHMDKYLAIEGNLPRPMSIKINSRGKCNIESSIGIRQVVTIFSGAS